MRTKSCLMAAGLLALLGAGTAPPLAMATEPAIREIKIHGPRLLPAGAASAEVGQTGGHLYAAGMGQAPAAGTAPWGAGDCVAEPPQAAMAAGLTKLAFCDDFSSAATIDLDGTLGAGFNWYIAGLPFGYQGTRKEGYAVQDGILTVQPDINQAQLSFLSAVVPKGAGEPVGWYIDREVEGWYAEARIAHDAKAVNGGFPAFWTMDMCHLYRFPRQCSRFVEPDFYEFIHGGDIRAVHLYQNPTGMQIAKLDMWLNYHPGESRHVNWLDFNIVALRALPDSVNHFVNDIQVSHSSPGAKTMNGSFSWLNEVVAGPPSHGDEVGRYPIIFGSGPEMPFKLDWVRVWVKPDAGLPVQ